MEGLMDREYYYDMYYSDSSDSYGEPEEYNYCCNYSETHVGPPCYNCTDEYLGELTKKYFLDDTGNYCEDLQYKLYKLSDKYKVSVVCQIRENIGRYNIIKYAVVCMDNGENDYQYRVGNERANMCGFNDSLCYLMKDLEHTNIDDIIGVTVTFDKYRVDFMKQYNKYSELEEEYVLGYFDLPTDISSRELIEAILKRVDARPRMVKSARK